MKCEIRFMVAAQAQLYVRNNVINRLLLSAVKLFRLMKVEYTYILKTCLKLSEYMSDCNIPQLCSTTDI